MRQCRHALGLSVRDICTLMQINRQTLYRWEWDENQPSLDDLARLADIFACSLDWLGRGRGRAPACLAKDAIDRAVHVLEGVRDA